MLSQPFYNVAARKIRKNKTVEPNTPLGSTERDDHDEAGPGSDFTTATSERRRS